MKRRMTEQQEFEIMKLVLDKFLWLGFIIMAFGVYTMISTATVFGEGFYYLIVGVVLLLLFLVVIVKEYEIIK